MIKYLLWLPLAVASLAAAEPAPKIVCSEPEFSFGTLDNTEVVIHEFILENRGDLSLEILDTRTSCGCTVASISRDIIPPGETATLMVNLDLKGRQGPQLKTVTVQSNDPSTPQMQLQLTGNSRPGLEIRPARVYLQNVSSTTTNTAFAEIISHREVLNIGQLETSIHQVAARLETVVPGKHFKIHVDTVPPMATGPFVGTVRVHTDSPTHPVINIGVMGSVVGPVAYAPEKILLSAKNQHPLTRYIAVRPGSFKGLQVTEVEIPDPEIKVRVFALASNQGFRLQLANVVAGDNLIGKAVIIHTNVPEMPEIRIPFEVIP